MTVLADEPPFDTPGAEGHTKSALGDVLDAFFTGQFP